MSTTASYSQSKLVSRLRGSRFFRCFHLIAAAQGNVVYAQEFSRRYGDRITSVSVHPGSVLMSIFVILVPY
jgi:hypothetical protein